MIKLYAQNQIVNLDWTCFRNGTEVKAYVSEMMLSSCKSYVKNVDASMYVLAIDDLLLPVTKTLKHKNNSYVVSPYTQYISYAIVELREIDRRLLKITLKTLLKSFGLFFRLGKIDDIVIVNNWLLSTNLYEDLTAEQAQRITSYLSAELPDSPIMFRSLTHSLHDHIINPLKQMGGRLIPSRSIYLFNPENYKRMGKRERQKIQQDSRLLKESGYTVITDPEIKETDLPAILSLYNDLYLEKYSYYNPQFTDSYIKQMWQSKCISFKLLKNGDQLVGVVGFILRNGVLTTPILGYDQSLPKSAGLYRLCSILLTEHALQTGYLLHRSAGAGKFKRYRGAENEIEYSLVYAQHTSLPKQLMWRALEFLLGKAAVPMLKKFEL